MLARMWRERNPCALLTGMQSGAATVENSMENRGAATVENLKKLKIKLPYDLVIPLLGIYPKKMKTLI